MGNRSSRSKVISPEILIKSVCNIPRSLSDNVTIIVIIMSRSLSNDAMVRRNKRDERVSYPVLFSLDETKQARQMSIISCSLRFDETKQARLRC